MSITANEIIFRKSTVNDDTGANGGRMTSVVVTSGVKNNVWPDVPQSERQAGSTKYRKVHIHVANDDDLTFVRPRVFIETSTPGDDYVTFFPGTHTDTQSSITGIERQYGAGKLNGDVLAGVTSIGVLTELAALNYIRNGDILRVSDKTTVDDAIGNEQYVTVSGVPSYSGDVATVVFTPALSHNFAASNTKVASVYEIADLKGSVSGWAETGSGTFNEATYPVLVDSIGGIAQTWTLTFTTPTTYNVVGDTVGAVGGGNVSSNFTPTNATYSKPYFLLPLLGWGGIWTIGDTIVFTTSPCAIPIWEKRIIPTGANSLSGNKVIFAVDGESA